MSLKVWLPLDGDLRNLGASDIEITNHGATVDNSGKIGKCYYFNGSSYIRMTVPTTITSIKNLTIAAWVKSTSTTLALGGLSHDAGNNTIGSCTLYSSGWQFSNNGSWGYVASGSIANTSVWKHVCCTIDNTKITTYLNGIQVASAAIADKSAITTLNSSNFIEIGCDHPGGDEYLTGYVNDFRIYDHCLSAAEVHEIAMGLVLHYKLDGNGFGNPNLLANSKLDGSWTYPSSSYSDKYSPITTSIPTASQYTLSFEAKSTVNGDKIRTHYYSPNTTTTCVSSQGVSKGASDGNMDFTLTTNWEKYWVIYSQNETTAAKHIICPRLVSGYGTGTVSVRNVKLEEGNIATPWCPNVNDNLYKILGMDDAIIKDSSGYGHNGTIINTITISSDTPRYDNCLHISAVNQKVQINNIITSGFGNSYSFAWWAKCSTFSGVMHWGFADGVRLNGIWQGNCWNTGDSESNPLYKPGTTTQVSIPTTNIWHHFVMTGDGTSCKVYKDGEYWGIAKTYKSISGTSIYLNGWNSSTSYSNSDLSLSDFRIYCTPLLDNDIKMLYNIGMKVDNLGEVHTFEFNENSNEKLLKTGVLQTNELEETSTQLARLQKDKGWLSSEFIEI